MKISILSNTSWYIYNFRLTLIKEILDQAHQVVTIAPIDDYTSKLEALGCTHIPVKIDSSSKNPLKDFITLFQLWNILHKQKPDVLLNYTAKANIYGTFGTHYLGIPTINNIAGLGSGFINETFTTKVLRFLYKTTQKKASIVFFRTGKIINTLLPMG